jgi:hypothetical protein
VGSAPDMKYGAGSHRSSGATTMAQHGGVPTVAAAPGGEVWNDSWCKLEKVKGRAPGKEGVA